MVHKRSVHEGIRFNCSVCDYRAPTKSSLAVHMRGAHSTTKLQCEQCGFQCKWKTTLRQHVARVYLGQSERFQCDECPATQSSLGNLKLHKNSEHLNIKFDCTQCGKSFKQKRGLTIHVKSVHDGEKQNCEVCGFETFFMAEHMKRSHDERCDAIGANDEAIGSGVAAFFLSQSWKKWRKQAHCK